MKTVIIVIGLLVPTILLAPVSSQRYCPASFTYVGGAVNGCYKLVVKRMTWDAAVARCQQLNPRAHLAIVDSSAKQQAMQDMMEPHRALIEENCKMASYLYPSVMIGAQRQDRFNPQSSFVWKLPDGTTRPLGYTYWSSGEPNNYDQIESCVKIFPVWNYHWNDAPCGRLACLMCELAV